MIRFEDHIRITAQEKAAIEWLSKDTSLSKQKLKTVMSNGCVWLENKIGINRLRRAKKILDTGDILHIYYDESIQNSQPLPAQLIADESEYSIWSKPCGMYSQGTKWGDHCSMYRWVEQNLKPQRPAFTVHRLDRAATGLMIITHSKKMATTFSELFKNRQIQKRYQAIVEGRLEIDTLPYTIDEEIDDKPAISKIVAINTLENNRSSINIEIETGRKHQIRKHLAGLGHPIVGDRLYGPAKAGIIHGEDLQLRSTYLKFNCPVTGEVHEYILQ
jgi:tRNA pseudouridine32 synthase/23S rRNA pseudouridine746 synthase